MPRPYFNLDPADDNLDLSRIPLYIGEDEVIEVVPLPTSLPAPISVDLLVNEDDDFLPSYSPSYIPEVQELPPLQDALSSPLRTLSELAEEANLSAETNRPSHIEHNPDESKTTDVLDKNHNVNMDRTSIAPAHPAGSGLFPDGTPLTLAVVDGAPCETLTMTEIGDAHRSRGTVRDLDQLKEQQASAAKYYGTHAHLWSRETQVKMCEHLRHGRFYQFSGDPTSMNFYKKVWISQEAYATLPAAESANYVAVNVFDKNKKINVDKYFHKDHLDEGTLVLFDYIARGSAKLGPYTMALKKHGRYPTFPIRVGDPNVADTGRTNIPPPSDPKVTRSKTVELPDPAGLADIYGAPEVVLDGPVNNSSVADAAGAANRIDTANPENQLSNITYAWLTIRREINATAATTPAGNFNPEHSTNRSQINKICRCLKNVARMHARLSVNEAFFKSMVIKVLRKALRNTGTAARSLTQDDFVSLQGSYYKLVGGMRAVSIDRFYSSVEENIDALREIADPSDSDDTPPGDSGDWATTSQLDNAIQQSERWVASKLEDEVKYAADMARVIGDNIPNLPEDDQADINIIRNRTTFDA